MVLYSKKDDAVVIDEPIENFGAVLSTWAKYFIILTGFGALVLVLDTFFGHSWLLDVVYYFSYVKMTVTLIKYTPQALLNYRRKSTEGWSIGNILLDFTG